jgi:hypothetical protein
VTDVTFWRVENRADVRVFPTTLKKDADFPRCKDFLESWKITLALSDFFRFKFSRRLLNGSGTERRSCANAGRSSTRFAKSAWRTPLGDGDRPSQVCGLSRLYDRLRGGE